MLVSLLIAVLIIAVICYVVTLIPIPAPFKTVIWLILAVIFIIWLVGYLPGGGLHLGRY